MNVELVPSNSKILLQSFSSSRDVVLNTFLDQAYLPQSSSEHIERISYARDET